jgi:hypothetical protein
MGNTTEAVRKLKNVSADALLTARQFGFSIAFWTLLHAIGLKLKIGVEFLTRKKCDAVKRYLYKNYEAVIERFRQEQTSDEAEMADDSKLPIWICWWDGEDKMPDSVRMCYRSVRRNAGSHPVRFVSKFNYNEYVSIPDYIFKMADEGGMCTAHLCDVLRVCLLYEHGGIWLDATFLLTEPLPPMRERGVFTIKQHYEGIGPYASEGRWTGGLLGGRKGHLLYAFLRAMYFEYCKKEPRFINYMLLDYLIAVAYESFDVVKIAVDDAEYGNSHIYSLQEIANLPFDRAVYREICSDTVLHRLPWRSVFREQTKDGEETFYGHLAHLT